ncbi:hypothetical protein MtrunA17_Chr8g0352981 [Medicago truncatula]|uniref:Uncharacterized protein n=1 Tax=Medicago truncatula TaxID=3880 RepID=A0A396GNN2_MEDTR|nr:hypothetical protein MtrunA17_Chr8g0352981 [Medicago truncatula]
MIQTGYKLTYTKKRKSECVVTHEDGKFQMKDDVAAIFVQSADLRYDDSGAARKVDSRSLDLELEFQEKIGFVMLQVFVTAHFFSLCIYC